MRIDSESRKMAPNSKVDKKAKVVAEEPHGYEFLGP